MTTKVNSARHRAATRPITPLSILASNTGESATELRRRTVVVAASSGLFVSLLGAAPASAAPGAVEPAVADVDVKALTAQVRQFTDTAPAITVASDATWTAEQNLISGTPAPEPTPEPTPEPEHEHEHEHEAERLEPAASRTAERSTLPSPSESAPDTVEESEQAPIPASASGSAIIEVAGRYVGVPYVWGGTTPDGFDCSGFTSYVYAQVGITIPRTSGDQQAAGTVVSRDEAQPGDLIFSPGHIGIYAGDNTQIDAPRPGKTIQFREIWQSNPTFVRM